MHREKSIDNYIDTRYTRLTIYRWTIYRSSMEVLMADNIALTESTYYILLSLYTPQHGYGIMQQTEKMSGGRIRLAAGTLYGALNSLCEKGWIVPLPMEEDSRKKGYKLTPKGLEVLEKELQRLHQLVDNGEMVLRGGEK